MKRIKRITAVLMAVMLLFTSADFSSFISLAAPESSSGATNQNQKGDSNIKNPDTNCVAVMRPAWLVYIETVDNTHTGEQLLQGDAMQTGNLGYTYFAVSTFGYY